MDDADLLRSLVAPCRYDRSSKEHLRDVQNRRLRAQLKKAYANVAYWHDLLDDVGVKPDGIQTVEDLNKLPVATKDQIVSRPIRHRLGADPSRLIQKFTSGTTGPPMEVYYSPSFVASTFVYLYGHFRSWFGLDRSYKVLQISSVAAAPSTEQSSHSSDSQGQAGGASRPSYSIAWPVIDRFVRSVHFDKRIETILPIIEAFSPDIIMINASYLRMLAEQGGETVASVRPKVLISTGEPLDEPTRSYAERRLRSPVCQMYGSNETASLALDCLEGRGLHIFSDRVIVEVLSKAGEPVSPGQLGEIVVTELLNDGMPLFRYRMRDLGYSSSETCSCGRSLPLVKSIEGREIDCIATDDGRLVTPKRILTLMHSVEGLPRCQLVQRSPDSFTLRVFPAGDNRDLDPGRPVSELVEALRIELGSHPDISISVAQSNERPRRKMRPVMVQMRASPV